MAKLQELFVNSNLIEHPNELAYLRNKPITNVQIMQNPVTNSKLFEEMLQFAVGHKFTCHP